MQQHHPLDIDLLERCLATADRSLPDGVEAHLSVCLLCRVRLNRIRRSNPRPGDPPAGVVCPAVSSGLAATLAAGSAPETAAAGQVWVAGGGDRVVVWVRSVCRAAVVVHPVTVDIDAVDDTGLIVDGFAAIGRPVAIVAGVVGTVPMASLVVCLGDLPVGRFLRRVAAAAASGISSGLATGTPIYGPADERIEFRQILADEIAALDPLD